jgi:phosphopantetheinyl transferase
VVACRPRTDHDPDTILQTTPLMLIPLAHVDADEATSVFHDFAEEWERRRLNTFVRHCDRRRYAHAHGAMRLALSQVLRRPTADVTLRRTRTGKPYLRGGPAFSLSYVDGDAWLAIGLEDALGLDVVDLGPAEGELDELVAPQAEKHAVALVMPSLARPDVVVWAAKEAAAKLADRVEVAPEDWRVRFTHCLEVSADGVPAARVDIVRMDAALVAAIARPLQPGDAATSGTQVAS